MIAIFFALIGLSLLPAILLSIYSSIPFFISSSRFNLIVDFIVSASLIVISIDIIIACSIAIARCISVADDQVVARFIAPALPSFSPLP